MTLVSAKLGREKKRPRELLVFHSHSSFPTPFAKAIRKRRVVHLHPTIRSYRLYPCRARTHCWNFYNVAVVAAAAAN
eukprot:scaffold945_cov170-Amphora_coffeaeformis.AAC.18